MQQVTISHLAPNSITRWSRPIFVWGIWVGMFVAALLFVARYGHNVPYYDEWSLVYTLAGTHPIDLEWLWYPRNGRRIAVPKLVLLGLLPTTGWDFRASMYVSVILLGAVSWVLIWAASRSRGSTSYADAIFPLLWLNWGHYDNMIWGWQLTQVLPIAVAAGFREFPEDGGAYWHESLAFCFDVLWRARIGAFEALAPEPTFHEIDIKEVAELSFIDDPQASVSEWKWKLVEARHIAGVRIMQPHQLPDGNAQWTLEWTRNSTEPFSRDLRYVHWWMEHEVSATVWIHNTIVILRVALPKDGTAPGRQSYVYSS